MGSLVVPLEVNVAAAPETVFGLFGHSAAAGWLFGAECDEVRPGAVVRLRLPLPSDIEASARIVEVAPGRRIVLEYENPWPGRLICTFTPQARGTRVRLLLEVPAEARTWLRHWLGESDGEAADDGAIRIGLLTTLSGSAGLFGRASLNCARMAVEEINAGGGVRGRPLRLWIADDATDPRTGEREMQRLVNVERVAAVIGQHSSATFDAARSVAEASGTLYLYTPVNESGVGGERLFRFGEVPADQLSDSIPRLMRDAGARSWFLAGNDYCWPRSVNRTARQVIGQRRGQVLGERYLALGTRHFERVVEQIEASGAELLLSSFIGGDAVAFERQFYAAGLRRKVRTLAVLLDEATREHVGDEAAAGIWTVFGYFMQLPTAGNAEFIRRYRQAFGPCSPPVSTLSESLYEAVHLYARGAAEAGNVAGDAVAAALPGVSFDGPRGRVRVNDQHRLEQRMFLAEAVRGGFAVRDELEPARACS